MGDNSGISDQIISLPKGGALQSIGEKSSPDLRTWTGNFTLPISLPPGCNGFQPQLSAVYNTGNGNESFGLGWSCKTSVGVRDFGLLCLLVLRDNLSFP